MNCPTNFTVVGHSCAFLSSLFGYNDEYWLDAKSSCESMGATLVSMKTEVKYKEVVYYLKSVAPDLGKINYLYFTT